MVSDIWKDKKGNHYQILADGVLYGPPDRWWDRVKVLQMLEAPWGVVVVRDGEVELEKVTEKELVLLGREREKTVGISGN